MGRSPPGRNDYLMDKRVGPMEECGLTCPLELKGMVFLSYGETARKNLFVPEIAVASVMTRGTV
jgi:hypothetical protein